MKTFFLSLSLIITAIGLQAQAVITTPEASQRAVVTQRIGITDITVVYHSPLTNGRLVWGGLVPMDAVWRAGANENTTVSFANDVKVEGKDLPAGTYGLHMIPTAGDWTVIFSKNYTSWGSFFYKKEEDALRVTVKPEECPAQDWLSYSFAKLQRNSAVLVLTWEKKRIPVKIEVDVKNIVLTKMHNELRTLPAFTWKGWCDAANYCLANEFNYEEAGKWIDRSIRMNENFENLQVKAGLDEKTGNKADAEIVSKRAMEIGSENEVNAYAYRLMGESKMKEAIDILKVNVKKYPASWNAYDSLAEAYGKNGDRKSGIENYKLALAKCPEDQKVRIQAAIKQLELGK
jgi:tetratricopeptide (TPR) repeat protein